MITSIPSQAELTRLIVELIINNTSKVTKVSDDSVLSAMAFAMGKVAQKATKEVAIVESHLLPDAAYGKYLDRIADIFGISPRYGATQSVTYVRVHGSPGTQYVAGTTTFTSTSGVVFEVVDNFTISNQGYGYVRVRSLSSGSSTNVEALTITKVSPIPSGHTAVFNEYRCTGGADQESDDDFRRRIKMGGAIAAKGTIEHLNQIFNKINPSILRTLFYGATIDGRVKLAVVTRNNMPLNSNELAALVADSQQYLTLTEYNLRNLPYIEVVNVDTYPIDVEIWLQTDPSVSIEQIRKDVQVQFSKYVDWRLWDWTQKVEWDNLLQIVKNTVGVQYVADATFQPHTDIKVPYNTLPIFRGFVFKDLSGNIVSDQQGILSPVYYQISPDVNYQTTVLSAI